MNKMVRLVPVFLFVVSLFGCAGETVKEGLNSPKFQAENLPIRTVRVLVVGDDPEIIETQVEDIKNASALLEPQVGIVFQVIGTRLLPHGESFENDVALAVGHLENFLKNEHLIEGKDFDIVVGAKESSAGLLSLQWLGIPIYNWQGVNDPRDGCWCHIVIKRRDVHTMAHEFMHAFVQFQFDPKNNQGHDTNGLMSFMEFSILPGIATTAIDAPHNGQNFLTPHARMFALRWKWMKFGMPSKIETWRLKEARSRK